MSLEQLTQALKAGHAFSDKSIAFLQDKGLEEPDFERLVEALFYLREKTFAERRKNQSWMEKMLDRGDSEEITTGRYNRYVDAQSSFLFISEWFVHQFTLAGNQIRQRNDILHSKLHPSLDDCEAFTKTSVLLSMLLPKLLRGKPIMILWLQIRG